VHAWERVAGRWSGAAEGVGEEPRREAAGRGRVKVVRTCLLTSDLALGVLCRHPTGARPAVAQVAACGQRERRN
jgi:hypothetical protein